MPGDKLGGRMSIQILDSALVSQIAAGEIIERPASIVKELVENSLDAGAKSLYIAVEEGGIRTIRVTDDGVGIAREELGLAVTPHATSKLSGAAGLETITGFGFRGEALASIAQVARVSLTSRTPDADSAWKIMLEPGLAGAPPAPAAHPSGTSVEVSQLFFSVPARRKFLRRPATEFAHIAEVVRRLALANPAVGFCLEHDGRPVIEVSPATSALRFRQIIGQRHKGQGDGPGYTMIMGSNQCTACTEKIAQSAAQCEEQHGKQQGDTQRSNCGRRFARPKQTGQYGQTKWRRGNGAADLHMHGKPLLKIE